MAIQTYAGYDLLTIVPNRPERRSEPLTRRIRRMELPHARAAQAGDGTPPQATHQLEWICATRAELAALEEFLTARGGRRRSFWLPSYRFDLDVRASAGGVWTVGAWGYAASLFPTAARRHVIGYSHGGARYRVWRVTAAADNGTGTEALTVSSQLDGGAAATLTSTAGGAFFLLMLARLAEDTIEIEHVTPEVTIVRASAVEVVE